MEKFRRGVARVFSILGWVLISGSLVGCVLSTEERCGEHRFRGHKRYCQDPVNVVIVHQQLNENSWKGFFLGVGLLIVACPLKPRQEGQEPIDPLISAMTKPQKALMWVGGFLFWWSWLLWCGSSDPQKYRGSWEFFVASMLVFGVLGFLIYKRRKAEPQELETV